MSLLFSLVPMSIPTKPEEPQKYYARSQTRSIITTRKLVEDISWGTTLTKGDVYHVVTTLVYQIKKHMLAGNCVELMELGKFRYHICSTGASSPEVFNRSYIRDVKVHFTPDPALKPASWELEYQCTIPVRNMRALKSKNRKTD